MSYLHLHTSRVGRYNGLVEKIFIPIVSIIQVKDHRPINIIQVKDHRPIKALTSWNNIYSNWERFNFNNGTKLLAATYVAIGTTISVAKKKRQCN